MTGMLQVLWLGLLLGVGAALSVGPIFTLVALDVLPALV
jgi:hypothetical protein